MSQLAAPQKLGLADYLGSQQSWIHSELDKILQPRSNRLRESMAYSLLLPSKRLRPIFCVETCQAFGESPLKALPAALALELVHTYSLVHDDLPSMDNDDLRRGMPTNHIRFGDATAILAGDGLLTKAFEVLAVQGDASAETRMHWVRELSVSAGEEGMVLGQELDIHPPALSGSTPLQRLENLHRRKTGALIAGSFVMGAIAAGANSALWPAVRKFGSDLGLAFQIQDDVLDVEGGAEIGKTQKSDEKNQKETYVKLLGLEGARNEAQKWTKSALDQLKTFPMKDPERLVELADFVISRNK